MVGITSREARMLLAGPHHIDPPPRNCSANASELRRARKRRPVTERRFQLRNGAEHVAGEGLVRSRLALPGRAQGPPLLMHWLGNASQRSPSPRRRTVSTASTRLCISDASSTDSIGYVPLNAARRSIEIAVTCIQSVRTTAGAAFVVASRGLIRGGGARVY